MNILRFDAKAALATTFLSVSLAVTAAVPASADTINIGAVDSLTGAIAIAGTADMCGIKVATEAINAAGGGRTIQLSSFDNQSNPAFAAQGVANLTGQGIKFFVGGSTSGTVLSTLPIIKDAGAIHGGGTTKAKEFLESGAMVFRLHGDNSQDGTGIAGYLKGLNAKRVAFVSLQGAYGQGALASLTASLPADIQVVNSYFAPADTTNFQSVVTSVVADQPDVVVMAIAGNSQPVAFLRQFRQSGPDAALVAWAGSLTGSVVQSAAGGAEAIVSSDNWLKEIDNPANKKLADDFAKYAPSVSECANIPLDKQVALSYSQVLLISEAVKATDSVDPVVVHKAILAGTWEMPQGTITFLKSGQAAVKSYMIVVKDGQIVPLN